MSAPQGADILIVVYQAYLSRNTKRNPYREASGMNISERPNAGKLCLPAELKMKCEHHKKASAVYLNHEYAT